MSRLTARLVLLTLPVFALAACGSSNEAEQLAQVQATASEAAAATKQAERDAAALRAKNNEQSLDAFYAGDEIPEDAGEPKDEPEDDGGPSAADEPSMPDAPSPPGQQSAPHPPPIPPVQ